MPIDLLKLRAVSQTRAEGISHTIEEDSRAGVRRLFHWTHYRRRESTHRLPDFIEGLSEGGR
jgi:hypothetical protein